MSGGTFDHAQYHIGDIAEQLESMINEVKNGSVTVYGYCMSETIKDKERFLKLLKETHDALLIAQEKVQRIDWFIAGDDGEETMYERLDKNLRTLSVLDRLIQNY